MTQNSEKKNPEFLYRFRSCEHLLNHGELEKQEIYFADSPSLNDPIEGYLDIFWLGDKILWTNLFKNYIYCIMYCRLLISNATMGYILKDSDIPILRTSDDFKDEKYRSMLGEVWKKFFENESINKLIINLGLSDRRIRRHELIFYLKNIHTFVLMLFSFIDGGKYSIIDKNKVETRIYETLKKLEDYPKAEDSNAERYESAYKFGMDLDDQNDLVRLYKEPKLLSEINKRFILYEFSKKYIERTQSQVYPEWYAACFTENIENASLWGHYGDGHKGICLKFKTKEMKDNLIGLCLDNEFRKNKVSGSEIMRFYRVSYQSKYPEVNFFHSLGRLTGPVLVKHWYYGDSNNISPYVTEIVKNDEKWRRDYWKAFHLSNTTKLGEWEYEGEWRVVLSSSFYDLSKKETRLLKYNFSDLEGIIFGLETTIEDKLKIFRIIGEKCDQNKNFNIKFYQAFYSHKDGKIKIEESELLKFLPTTS
ncbi:MAG TPA: DUF2971 domain-containing protein [bacterium]|nr:DUF2971 domain-containing protein [bacterium]